jgi:hypothetical protein
MPQSDRNDRMVDLDELFWVIGSVVLVDRPMLELVQPDDLTKLGCQSMEHAPV